MKRAKVWMLCVPVAAALAGYFTFAGAKEWKGVDETVVEKYALEHGRRAMAPLINTDQGDLLLFVFLISGAIGGFLAGYCFRMLVAEKPAKI